MAEEKRVKFLSVSVKVSTYKILQMGAIILLAAGAVLSYLYLREHSRWVLRNLWWICLAGIAGEIIEGALLLKKAKKE